jgi:heme exporter protein A
LASDPPAVLARDLRARFGAVEVLHGLSFEAAAGDRLAIFGPNGAGKTTLLKVLAGILRPSGGELRIAGLDPLRDAANVRRRLGVLSHQTYLYGELTALENLRFYGRLYSVPSLDDRVGSLLEQVGLYGRRFDRVDSFSRGMQQRLAIARTILHQPQVLLLDEPDTGLDLSAYHLLESVLIGSEQRRTVLMATHNLEQARRLCRRALVVVSGRLVGEMPVADLDSDRLSAFYQARTLAAK